ncbi:MAG: hypothetical protein EYC68_08675 [Chloroflexota bacterium]|nr:MAG: hypothetical protein EYC68_08675 [Chloroflexota bacterium]
MIFNACSTSEEINNLDSISEPTLAAFQFGEPITTKQQAVIAARLGINASRLHFVGEPRAVRVEEMTRKQAEQIVRSSNQGAIDATSPTDLPVWFVVFESIYHITPPGPDASPLPQKHGCVFVILNSQDGAPLQVGGEIPCPTKQ